MAEKKKNKAVINDKSNWWREKSKMEKMFMILPLILSFIAIGVSVWTHIETMMTAEIQTNKASYFDQLNFKISWEKSDDDATIIGTSAYTPGVPINLPNQKFTVEAITGGIKNVSALFYYRGECMAIVKIDMSDRVDHVESDASDMMYACEVITFYPQEFESYGAEGRYFTSIYIVVEDYNNDRYIVPTVFEFGADAAGHLNGKQEVRQYNGLDILYTFNKETQAIPDFDFQVLEDYKKIKSDTV